MRKSAIITPNKEDGRNTKTGSGKTQSLIFFFLLLGVCITLFAITTATAAPTPVATKDSGGGWYVVNGNVNGATVSFDNQVVGVITQGTLTVPVYTTGTPYQIYAVSMNGYLTYTAALTSVPAPGQTVNLYATLIPVPTVAPPTVILVPTPVQTTSTKITTTIYIRNNSFVPNVLTILPGTSITWINDDATVHAIKSTGSQNGFRSGDFVKGAQVDYTFGANEGTFEIIDTYTSATCIIIVKKGESIVGNQITPTMVVTTPQVAPVVTTPPTQQTTGSSDPSGLIILLIIGVVVIAGGYIGYTKMKKPDRKESVSPPRPKILKDETPVRRSNSQSNQPVAAEVEYGKWEEPIKPVIEDLESFNLNAKPNLAINLTETKLAVDKWHKVELQINNTGDAHASDILLTFSDDFETRWVTPVSVNATKSETLQIGIKPKTEGNIPIEINAKYNDRRGKDYLQTFKFWINVTGKTGFEPSGTPSASPVSQFTPKPLTTKQLPPDLSDHYTESEFIGKGGFARVFKAKRKDGKFVAVKIPITMDAITGKSFIAEMQNWTKLSHPNIVKLYDFNIMPMPYFEEELCDSALAELKKPLECEEAAWILFNVCEGLKFAHEHKIIHRDLKPQNILLKNGTPKISDWGLSRIVSESTSTTATAFTPYYAAPEQINNRVKDERTDIWQIGVILYEFITGEMPFRGDSMIDIAMNIATKDPKSPRDINPEAKVLESVVMKCLQKDPAKRYQSVLELQKELGMYLRENYSELLKKSVSAKDFNRSSYFCGDLVMVNLLTGDMKSAYKYLLDLIHYSKGDVKVEAQELSEQIKMRMEEGVTEIPDELIQKAEIIVHQVSVGFRKKGSI